MKYSFICLVFLFHLSIGMSAQSTAALFHYTNALKLSPFNLGQSELQASYEHYFNDRKMSISISPSIFLKETQDVSLSGLQVMMQYRFYLTHFNKDERNTFLNVYNYGFYTGFYGLYFDYSEDYQQGYWSNSGQEYIFSEFTRSSESIEGGALIGVQIDITKRILIDFYMGGGVRFSDSLDTYFDIVEEQYNVSESVFDPGYTGVKPKVGFQLGILF